MLALTPIFRFLDAHKIPHMLFINKMDGFTGSVRELIGAAQRQSSRPLVLRHIPIVEGSNHITGYARSWSPSAPITMNSTNRRSAFHSTKPQAGRMPDDARRQLLEKLSDFDDALLEKLLEDVVPDKTEVYRLLTKDFQEDLIVPVLIGAAEHMSMGCGGC